MTRIIELRTPERKWPPFVLGVSDWYSHQLHSLFLFVASAPTFRSRDRMQENVLRFTAIFPCGLHASEDIFCCCLFYDFCMFCFISSSILLISFFYELFYYAHLLSSFPSIHIFCNSHHLSNLHSINPPAYPQIFSVKVFPISMHPP